VKQHADLIDCYLDSISTAPSETGLILVLSELCEEVAATERDRCARLVEESIIVGRARTREQEAHAEAAKHIATAIRGRENG
jgi:hypothetical protein